MKLIDVDYYCNCVCLCNKEKCNKEACPLYDCPTVDAVKLAFRVGDTVYCVYDKLDGLCSVFECRIYSVRVYKDNEVTYKANVYDYEDDCIDEILFDDEEIGQTIFLTMEEALKRRDERVNELKSEV